MKWAFAIYGTGTALVWAVLPALDSPHLPANERRMDPRDRIRWAASWPVYVGLLGAAFASETIHEIRGT